jgi:hypothetical protein
MAAANLHSSKTTESPVDPRESGTQLRPGLWQTINERYPGSMITKSEFIPLARLAKPLKGQHCLPHQFLRCTPQAGPSDGGCASFGRLQLPSRALRRPAT